MRIRQLLRGWWHYVLAIVLVALATVLGHAAGAVLTVTNVAMLYLLCVVTASALWGLGTAILTCILSVLAHDFFFTEPFLSFGPPDIHDVPTLIVLLIVGVIISSLTSRIRSQAQEARHREHETATLYNLSRSLSTTSELRPTIDSIIAKTKEIFGYESVIFLPNISSNQQLYLYKCSDSVLLGKDDYSAAALSFYQRKAVGNGTGTLSQSKARYMPLNSASGAVGVLSIYPEGDLKQITKEQSGLLQVFADLSAISIERAQLVNKVRDAQISAARDKLQASLFSSITHDLRTPLVSIIGVLSSLRERHISMDDSIKEKMIQVASEEADRLNRLIANLLDSSRIESGSVKLHRQPSEIQEVVSTALEQMKFDSNLVTVNIPEELSLISIDFTLMTHVFANIIDNAVKYSPAESAIEINARELDDEVEILIEDHGIGIPSNDLPHVFDRFYRVQRPDSRPGTGLGLSICKGIVEAHKGTIMAENRPGGGTIIRIILPISEKTLGCQ
jgi:two-component system, OmpR family, sensor histidine kinase KdpD